MAPSVAPALLGLLAEETKILQSFVALLRREQVLLGEGKVDDLIALAAEKSAFADRLASVSLRREEALAAEGYGNRMGEWLAASGDPAHKSAWQRVLDLAREAKSLNETNGGLIALHFQHHQQALNVLLAAANRTMTYGPDGQQKPVGGGRNLGSA